MVKENDLGAKHILPEQDCPHCQVAPRSSKDRDDVFFPRKVNVVISACFDLCVLGLRGFEGIEEKPYCDRFWDILFLEAE